MAPPAAEYSTLTPTILHCHRCGQKWPYKVQHQHLLGLVCVH